MHEPADTQDTAVRAGVTPPGIVGVAWSDQRRPFQRSATATPDPEQALPLAVAKQAGPWPTATHDLLDEHETALSAPTPARA